MTFNFLNNGTSGALPGFDGQRSNAINLFANASHTGSFEGTLMGNFIGRTGVAESGSDLGNGIRLSNEGAGTVTVEIDDNTIQQIQDFEGILVIENVTAGDTAVTITNNVIDQIINDRGMNVIAEIDGGVLCANIEDNTVTNTAANPPGSPDCGLRVRQKSNATLRVERYSGGATDATAMGTHLETDNPLANSGCATVNAAFRFDTPVPDGDCRTP